MWEETATVKRQSDDDTIDQNSWDSSPTNPQDNIISNNYLCSVRFNSPEKDDSGQGFNVTGDAIIVGENSIEIKSGDEIILEEDRKFKVLNRPISFRNWLRIEVERL
ncbi:MAG: hypothetical protein R6V17_07385 [Halanaerobacter sp.]